MTIGVIKWFIKMYTGDILSKIMIIYCLPCRKIKCWMHYNEQSKIKENKEMTIATSVKADKSVLSLTMHFFL